MGLHSRPPNTVQVPATLPQRSGANRLGSARGALASFGVKVADFFEQLWFCCNTLRISKESPTAERIAWFAT